MKQINMLFFTLLACALAHGQKIDWNSVPLEVKEPVQFLDANDEESDALYIGRGTHLKWNTHDQRLYVSDGVNHQIHLYDSNLKYVKSIGRMGQGPGEFYRPVASAFTSAGGLAVYDGRNHRIQVLSSQGTCLCVIPAQSNSGFEYMVGIDHLDRIYVNLPRNKALFTVYSLEGEWLGELGTLFAEDGNDNVNLVDFAVDSSGIYCVFNERPLLRKYDMHWQLVYEIDLSDCPEVQDRMHLVARQQAEADKKFGVGSGHNLHLLSHGISLDEACFYVHLWGGDDEASLRSTIYAFSKGDVKLRRRIRYASHMREEPPFCSFPDLGSMDWGFALAMDQCSILKFNK